MTLGPEHPSTLITAGNLASLLRDQGDLHRASKLEEQIANIRSK